MNNYIENYLRAIKILIKLEENGLIREEWEIQNFTKAVVLQDTYRDGFEIPVDEFTSASAIENILKDDYSEFRI